MCENKINLKIITPYRTVKNLHCNSIQLTNTFGVFEILPNHENYITILEKGIIAVSLENNGLRFLPHFIISRSFLKFKNSINTCYISSEYAINILQVKEKDIEKQYIRKRIRESCNNNEKDCYELLGNFFRVT